MSLFRKLFPRHRRIGTGLPIWDALVAELGDPGLR